jgi:hypothetical protein
MQNLTPHNEPDENLTLGIPGFSYSDLYKPERLKDLAELFYETVQEENPELYNVYMAYLNARGIGYAQKAESDILLSVAPMLSRFIARLFQIEKEREELKGKIKSEDPVFEFKRFVARRALKKVSIEQAEPR